MIGQNMLLDRKMPGAFSGWACMAGFVHLLRMLRRSLECLGGIGKRPEQLRCFNKIRLAPWPLMG